MHVAAFVFRTTPGWRFGQLLVTLAPEPQPVRAVRWAAGMFMSFLDRFFGARQAGGETAHPDATPQGPATPSAQRRELLRVVFRDTVAKHGIPPGWIGAELLPAPVAHGREPDIHVRLQIRHWDTRLLPHAVAFQRSLHKRLEVFDPQSASWLTGFSWQFVLPDAQESLCPAMPDPAVWRGELLPGQPLAAATASIAAAAPPLEDRKAALNRLLDDPAGPDTEGSAPDPDKPDFEATQPMQHVSFEATQAMKAGMGFEDTQRMYVPTQPAKL
jgi:hypothetical protein